jgi:hypothetical protein
VPAVSLPTTHCRLHLQKGPAPLQHRSAFAASTER